METTEIKTDLHQKIDQADAAQIKEIYGLVINYLNGNNDTEGWDLLTEVQQSKILKGLDQADAGLGNTLDSVNQRIRAKYGING